MPCAATLSSRKTLQNFRNLEETLAHRQVLECASPLCSLHASFVRRGGDGAAKSSVRSAMFIATRAAQSAKLRRSGMCLCALGYCGGFLWAHGHHSCRATAAWVDVRGVVSLTMFPLTDLY